MAFGLMIKNAAAGLQVQYIDTLPRILGEFDTGLSDGSISAPGLAGGTPFFFIIGGDGLGSYQNMPVIVQGTNAFSWYFVSATSRISVRVAYGRIG